MAETAAPPWHRPMHSQRGEFVVIAQGLIHGGAVPGAAARLVHAFDAAPQDADLSICPEVAIGILFAPQHGARAEPMLAAAESGLRDRSRRRAAGSARRCVPCRRRAR